LRNQRNKLTKARQAGDILGINIGKNKDSEDAIADYTALLQGIAGYADYVTVNISSPNTPGLRDLQSGSALAALLDALCAEREKLNKYLPLWLKIAPDLTDDQCRVIAETVLSYPIDALVIGNTTVARDFPLTSGYKNEQGGLSGKPLMVLSTDRLALFYRLTNGKLPLIGVGGIASAEDVYAKIRAGASLVQLYSALVFQGFGLVTDIQKGLADLLQKDGFASLDQAIGLDAFSRIPQLS
jgi:dihydroorotate dehydrogenase